jgi:hypothetical protein
MTPRSIIVMIALLASAASCGPRGAGEPADSLARRRLRAMLQVKTKSIAIRSRATCDTWKVDIDVNDGEVIEGKLTRTTGPETLEPVQRQVAIDESRMSVSSITRNPGGRSVSNGVGASLCVIEAADLVELESGGCVRVAKDTWSEVWCADTAACTALATRKSSKGEVPMPDVTDRPSCFDD